MKRRRGRCAGCDPADLDYGAVTDEGDGATLRGALEEHPILVATSVAGGALGAYHGYRRNKSIGWAIGWSLLGSIAPFITIPVSLAQGFGKPR